MIHKPISVQVHSGTHGRSGQVILLSVIMLSGILISASVVAGLLMAYQIRHANDAVESTKALFAADAGIESTLFCYFYSELQLTQEEQGTRYCEQNNDLGNGSSYDAFLTFRFNASGDPVGFTAQAYGSSGKTNRALETRITTRF